MGQFDAAVDGPAGGAGCRQSLLSAHRPGAWHGPNGLWAWATLTLVFHKTWWGRGLACLARSNAVKESPTMNHPQHVTVYSFRVLDHGYETAPVSTFKARWLDIVGVFGGRPPGKHGRNRGSRRTGRAWPFPPCAHRLGRPELKIAATTAGLGARALCRPKTQARWKWARLRHR